MVLSLTYVSDYSSQIALCQIDKVKIFQRLKEEFGLFRLEKLFKNKTGNTDYRK
jgi:hypothetical protein